MPTGNEFSAVRYSNSGGQTQESAASGEYGQVTNPSGSDNDPSSYKTRSSQGVTGEFDTCRPEYAFGAPYPGTDMVPSPSPSKQFSSDVTGEPKALCQQTQADVMMHSDLNQSYGLNQSMAGLGTHPWLRDSLSTPGENEPGNAVPAHNEKVPMIRNVK